MINIINGNILDAKEDIIVHQVNCKGIMGGGVARQLANQYKDLEKEYSQFCKNYNNDYERLKGSVVFYRQGKTICNMFSQKENFNTDYESMKLALNNIKKFAIANGYSIAIPYKIGCGIANGDWSTVEQIIIDTFADYDVTLYRLGV